MKKVFLVLLLSCVLPSCSSSSLGYEPLLSQQAKVLTSFPQDGQIVEEVNEITLAFSEFLLPETLTDENVQLLLLGTSFSFSDLSLSEMQSLPGSIDMEDHEEGSVLIFTLHAPLEAGNYYALQLKRNILNRDYVPLFTGTKDFLIPLLFKVKADGDNSTSFSRDEENAVPKNRPQVLMIHELLYDLPGSDTNGEVFIELYGTAGADISGYHLLLLNGENGETTQTIVLPSHAKLSDEGLYVIADAKNADAHASFVEGADYITQFDPQNGPDCIQLFDDRSLQLDALAYGDFSALDAQVFCGEGEAAVDVSAGMSLSRGDEVNIHNNAQDFVEAFPTASVF
ncbi:MAG: hypothetical protein COV43_06915 [Deltaproteobacteria bacterium CG11_big_fil_rev_8_21_14_0_20_42_23]|nr:MAG: hypothetical protein COV43_06915 [Deltaproteobacteria bacterium CG11_big_fil_rev_8_21_14_0_20_42_23]PJC65245.1 MAG: hypothetical protein CO021_00220 [Deltaproteobacteria bacterium CG_4_9_14_0_2_um_filter_42_21]